MFIALEKKPGDSFNQILSPQFMSWSDDVFIYDLQPCLAYWDIRTRQVGLNLQEFFTQLLAGVSDGEFRAAIAPHPWQALLLVEHMKAKNLFGLLDLRNRLGAHVYQSVSWDTWWNCAGRAIKHLERQKFKSSKFASFQQRRKQMQQTVSRLNIATPWALKSVGAQAIHRRYGSSIKRLWDWSYDAPAVNTNDFPWERFEVKSAYQVHRNLDTPLCEWDHLQPFLRDDFDRLCELTEKGGVAQQKIVSLEWQLSLADGSSHIIPVRFRHPHSLSREKSAHGTALLQAYYSFQSNMLMRKSSAASEGLPQFDVIVAWDLRITEFINIPQRISNLFGDESQDDALLVDLENRLSQPLFHYDLRNDWTVEESFVLCANNHFLRQDQIDNESFLSMSALAKRRPLFLLKERQVLPQDGRSGMWRFSERTMAKWWQGSKPEDSQFLSSDYYRYVDAKRRALWVSRSASQRWYVHGIFA